ncbi:SMC-Scp complex subunit ScpB [Rubinisphaera margarita]|uniref:SMC-Scp complex subunit ScpB n=1 Tax=Rubinisphaera margarita TaxID=2909586 RepID=UPI001EE82BDF|nr:SMC-Scp complex subunit ScpB [Rubinisphaera margarita]MCG6154677.1 SMC-Scp complex subunit ScpB [Rubinisphaera margarita]
MNSSWTGPFAWPPRSERPAREKLSLAVSSADVQAPFSCIRTPQLARLEAALFVADAPLSAKKLADAAKLIDTGQCHLLVEQLNEMYDHDQSPFRIEQIASGYQLLTRSQYSQWLDRIHHRHVELKLTPPTLETLTIIAYRQPITRADVEAIRGVQSSEVIKQLMERQLIRIGGEEDSLGRPYLYETTKTFLQFMGIRRIDQLPNYAELRKPPATETESTPPENAAADDDSGETNHEESQAA